MTDQNNKDLVLTSLDLMHGLADENSNLPAMHQIRLLTNDLIDLINGGIVLIRDPLDEVVLPDPPIPGSFLAAVAQAAPPPQMAPPMPPAPWPTQAPCPSPFPPGAKLTGVNKLRQMIFDMTTKDIGGYAAERLYTSLQEPVQTPEDTLLLDALEREVAKAGVLHVEFQVRNLDHGMKVSHESGPDRLIAGHPRDALRALKEAQKPD